MKGWTRERAIHVADILREFPEIALEVGLSGDGGEFRSFVEERHGDEWIALAATDEEIREECRAYLALRQPEVVH